MHKFLEKPTEFFLVTKKFIAEEVARQDEFGHVTYRLLVSQIEFVMRKKYNCSSYYTEINKDFLHVKRNFYLKVMIKTHL